jgi:very-short-patch-repair endonuclease
VPRQCNPIDLDDLRERYLSGESPQALAARYGVSRKTITNRLLQLGVPLRGHREGQLNSWINLDPEARRARLVTTHSATRGRTVSLDKRLRDAAGREATGSAASELEHLIATELHTRGVQFGQQTAVGPYNCDFTSGTVAVEVFGGGWHWSGDHALRHRERSRYLLDQGWHLLVLLVDHRRPLTPGGYDKIIAFLQFAQSDPAAPRQYWVIGGTGQVVTGIRPDLDPITRVRPVKPSDWPRA